MVTDKGRKRPDDAGTSRPPPDYGRAARIIAQSQRPRPNTVCVVRLFNRAAVGLGVFDDAMPIPSAGCIVKTGRSTVAPPKASAGRSVGRPSQSGDATLTNTRANVA